MDRKHYFKSESIILYREEDKYYKNEVELKLESDEAVYSELDFDKEIKSAVSEWINNSFDNIVCLIGAGASVVSGEDGMPDKKYGHTVEMIADEIFSSLESDSDVFSLNYLQELVQYPIKYMTYEERKKEREDKDEDDKDEDDKDKFNLEDFLSFLLSYEKFVSDSEKKKFDNSKRAIFQEIIRATSYDYDAEKFKHAKFLNILSKLTKKEKKLNIITTNYDTLIEDSANQEGFTVLDGFKFAQIPMFDASMFDWHLIKDVPNIKTQEVEYMSKVINLLKIHGSITWELNSNKKNIVRKSKNTVKNPVMVFPSSDKYAQSYQEPYFELFTKFQELLKRNNTLLVTLGFSFADNHISRMILQAIKSNDSLHVLASDYNIDPEKPNENWKELKRMQERSHQIAFLQATMNDKLTDYLGGIYEH